VSCVNGFHQKVNSADAVLDGMLIIWWPDE
jgi:hypothetical protein